ASVTVELGLSVCLSVCLLLSISLLGCLFVTETIPSTQQATKNGDTAVIIAVKRHDPATLRELVRAESDLNLQNQEGLTPLMIAARSWRTDITNILLEGENINLDIQEKGTGWSALHFSAETGNSATTVALLKAGANPRLKDKNGDTAVIIAVKRHDPVTLRELVREGSDLNLQNQEGLTPLMIAARRGMADITKILLEGEHIMDIQEKGTGWSALRFSAERGYSATTEALLKAGANAHLKDKNGDTAVIIAVKRCHPATLRELVRAGSDLNLQNQEGLTPLMIAARSWRTDITNILLEGENINLDIQEKGTGRSAFHFSAETGNSATTVALLKAGANPRLKDKNGDTAVIIAVKRHDPATLRELVRAGSDLNLQNQEGLTPLMIAARRGMADITKILLEGEYINLDIQEKRIGQSALHFSAVIGDAATIEELLLAGANRHIKDKNGVTATEITEQRAQYGLESETLAMGEMMSQSAMRQLKSESKDIEGDDTSSSCKIL
ncbi:Putative ankyrin repeat protein MM_0045, partial [Geodia barretti]